jgi:uncharacterized protein YecT (DUF1311 family)
MFTQLLSRALATTAAIVGLAASASAQCQNPTTDAQRAQCLGDELRGTDRTINRVYAELVKSLAPADRLTLRDDKRAWLKTRDRTCGITWSQGDRATWFADLLRDYQKTVCVVRLTNERVTVLNGYQNRIDKNLEPQVFGFAVDLDNGRLYIGDSGAWPDGEPGSAGGSALIHGRGYRMMLTSSVAVNEFLRSGTLTVNLGERGFVYSVPAGYRPLQPR